MARASLTGPEQRPWNVRPCAPLQFRHGTAALNRIRRGLCVHVNFPHRDSTYDLRSNKIATARYSHRRLIESHDCLKSHMESNFAKAQNCKVHLSFKIYKTRKMVVQESYYIELKRRCCDHDLAMPSLSRPAPYTWAHESTERTNYHEHTDYMSEFKTGPDRRYEECK